MKQIASRFLFRIGYFINFNLKQLLKFNFLNRYNTLEQYEKICTMNFECKGRFLCQLLIN